MPQGDPVSDLVSRFMGENEARKRSVLTADSVPQDENGLTQLVVGYLTQFIYNFVAFCKWFARVY